MGGARGPSLVNQTSFAYTATKSIFTFDVDGKISLTATFLSPVHPNDLLRQSMQFSYLQVSVESSDGNPHDIQIYSDVSGGEPTLSLLDGVKASACSFQITVKTVLLADINCCISPLRIGCFGHEQLNQVVKRT